MAFFCFLFLALCGFWSRCLCFLLPAQMVDESALLDLKHLLMEAQQRVPPVLMALEDPDQEMDEVRAFAIVDQLCMDVLQRRTDACVLVLSPFPRSLGTGVAAAVTGFLSLADACCPVPATTSTIPHGAQAICERFFGPARRRNRQPAKKADLCSLCRLSWWPCCWSAVVVFGRRRRKGMKQGTSKWAKNHVL